jgi:hypothetical protein
MDPLQNLIGIKHMMWTHYCPVDRTWIDVGKGEPCNWCGACAPRDKRPLCKHPS